jgi:hypothetical protein
VRHPRDDSPEPVVTTTALAVPPQELDQAGLELQRAILADGEVTRDELVEALEGWKACMEDRGLIEVSYRIGPQGLDGMGYGSHDEFAGEAEDAACRASYINDVVEAVGR